MQRYNHLIDNKNENALKALLNNVISYSMPLCVITITTLILLMEPIIISWVGASYSKAVIFSRILIGLTVFSFINIPANHIFNSKLKYNYIYIIGVIAPILFLLGILLGRQVFGVLIIPYSKLSVSIFIFIFCLIGIFHLINFTKIIKKIILQLLIVTLIIIPNLVNLILPILNIYDKSSTNLFIILFFASCIIIFSYLFVMLTVKSYRYEVINLAKTLLSSIDSKKL